MEELLNCADYEDKDAVSLIYELHGRTRGNYDIRCIIEEINSKNRKTEESWELETDRQFTQQKESMIQDSSLLHKADVRSKLPKPVMMFLICILPVVVCFSCIFYFRMHGIRNPIPVALGIMTSAALCMYMVYKVYDSRAILAGYFRNFPAARKKEEMPECSVLKLVSDNTIDTITVSKTPFLLGSDEHEADGLIVNPLVGRLHARIERIAGSFFLEDLSSANGTFYNGIRVEREEKVRLLNCDTVCFAGQEYVVSLR